MKPGFPRANDTRAGVVVTTVAKGVGLVLQNFNVTSVPGDGESTKTSAASSAR